MRYAPYQIFRIFFFLAFAAFSFPTAVFAGLQITEVMYDVPGTDTGREWIEVKNTGPDPIDLSLWKLFEANINHKIAAIGPAQLQVGDFAVIADSPDKFKADNPGYTGLLFDSAFSLTNEGEAFILRDSSGADVDSISYLPAWGAGGDGNSLQRTLSGQWIAALPTVGVATVATQSVTPSVVAEQKAPSPAPTQSAVSTAPDASISAHSGQETANLSPDEPSLEVTSGRSRLGFVGSPLSFETKVKAPQEINSTAVIESVWSMGDGTSLFGNLVHHTYAFPGDYIVILNARYKKVQAISRVSVKVVEPHVFISRASRLSVTVSNPDDFEMNLGGYSFVNKGLNEKWRFVVAQDTIIRPRSSLALSYPNQRLGIAEKISLIDPSDRQVSTAPIENGLTVTVPTGVTLESIKKNLSDLQK